MEHWNIMHSLRMVYITGIDPRYRKTFIQRVLFLVAIASIINTTCLAIGLFIYEENLELLDFTEGMQTVMFCLHVIGKFGWFYIQHDRVIDLLNDGKQFWDVNEHDDEEEKKKIVGYLRYMKLVAIYYLLSPVPTVFMLVLKPLIEHGGAAFKCYIPRNQDYYYATVALGEWLVVVIYMSCLGFDVFFGTIIALTAIQWKMLNKQIEIVLANTLLNDENRLLVQNKLNKCIAHHNFLLNFVKKINTTISLGLLTYIGVIILSTCVELFAIVSGKPGHQFFNSVDYIISLTIQFVVLYIIPGQLLTAEAEKTEQVAFDSQWYKNSKFNKPIITMISCIGQKPVYINAFNIINLTYLSGLQAYKTMFSYYMFLRTMKEQ
ncbi:unnamed protein product [Psylliodes chrysocephalus]|uniref:Odorant receptor n=1 Tax=Psylliodes chrysocephalus TaxID=3402493 RepID=A0A9P0CS08_9CUCU|nr:unnamed protein product [Psylliodes chrysocephala]